MGRPLTVMAELKVGLVSLGCPKNLVDSEVMLGLLEQAGCQITIDEAEADVLIINTCGFIKSAQQEAINTILEMSQYKELGRCRALIVAGCLVQRFAKELAAELPEIDALIGVGEVHRIVPVIEKVLGGERVEAMEAPSFLYSESWPRKLSTPGHYAYIKVSEGCDNRCSYCTIPDIRGRFRSRPIESVVREAEALVQAGVKEIILIAQDTTRYGEDIYGTPVLADLLKELTHISNLTWIRWMYGYPTRITPELIRVMAESPKICSYIDLPLQHIDRTVLRQMNRPADPDQTRELISDLRENIPDLTLRTSFIVGYPGESEEAFNRLLAFLEEIRFDRVGAFTYSAEQGTKAAELPKLIPEDIKIDRYNRLMECQQQISLEKNQEWVGKSLDVLVEGFTVCQGLNNNNEITVEAYGRSKREAPGVDGLVYIQNPLKTRLSVGDMVKIKICQADYYDLIGEVRRESAK